MDTNIDLSSLSIEKLEELLRLKKGSTKVSDVPSTEIIQKDEKNICTFCPTKSNQAPCAEIVSVKYGDRGFCKKHSRTVQALKARKNEEELNAVPEILPVEEPIKLVEPEPKPEVQSEGSSVNIEDEPKEIKTAKKKVSFKTPVAVEKSIKKVESKILKETPAVVKRKIKQNKWGRFEDEETGILFDPKTKAAYGVQDKKGGVLPLDKKALAFCDKYKWKRYSVNVVEEESSSSEPESEEKSEEPVRKPKKSLPTVVDEESSNTESSDENDEDNENDEEENDTEGEDNDEEGEDNDEDNDDDDGEDNDEDEDEDEEGEDDETDDDTE